MRGEDVTPVAPGVEGTGSPPHARGRRTPLARLSQTIGITPACAGKTPRTHTEARHCPDHPRMRGEDIKRRNSGSISGGSPPHARGRLTTPASRRIPFWITPACAGKTPTIPLSFSIMRDHPRMRGEDQSGLGPVESELGSPPHARGRLGVSFRPSPISGITPACAGKTRMLLRAS